MSTDRRPRLRAVLARLGMGLVRTDVHAWDEPLPGWEQDEVFYEIERSDWLGA